jgi:hypothetical protein
MSHLNKPHTALGKSSGHQALPAKIFSDGIIDAVELQRGWRFT